jgi:hypothetical protein
MSTTVGQRFLRCLAGSLLIVGAFSGCLGRLIADKGMSESHRLECNNLVRAVKSRFQLADFRIPPGLHRLIGTKVLEGEFPRHDLWPEAEPRSIGCSTEVRGAFLTLYTVVELWRISDPQDQAAIVAMVQEQRRSLEHPKPTLVRFVEREVWEVFRDIRGEAYGYGRGKEQVLRQVAIR